MTTTTIETPKWGQRDALWWVSVSAVWVMYVIGIGVLLANRGGVLFEDAAMLLRYAEHLHGGHGIVWNVGGPAVDGATDFGSLLLTTALMKLNLSAVDAVLVLNLTATSALIWLVWWSARNIAHRGPVIAASACGLVIAANGLLYTQKGFTTPVFAFACAAVIVTAARLIQTPTPWTATTYAVAMIACGLVRPEGVIIIVLVAGVTILVGGRQSVRPLLIAVGIAAMVGIVYFVWHWWYFGYPLPNPYYKKGGDGLYPQSLMVSVKHVIRWCTVPLLIITAELWSPKLRRSAFGALILVGGMTSMWVLLSDEMNWMGRFQFPIVVSCAVLFPMFSGALEQRWLTPASITAKWLTACLVMLVGITTTVFTATRIVHNQAVDGRETVALTLRDVRDPQDRLMVVTEAGLLPFYSTWNAIDAWGLNDQAIAHNGRLDTTILDTQPPDLIMSHTSFPPGDAFKSTTDPWDEMTVSLDKWARSHSYDLAACWTGGEGDYHQYLVNPRSSQAQRIHLAVNPETYMWWSTGKPAVRCI